MPEPKFWMDVVRENNGIIASWLLSFFVLWSGVITSVICFINRDFVVVWVGAGLFAISWFIKLPQIHLTRRMEKKADLERAEEGRKQREKELDRIRKSMTPGEWEMYKIQLENQKLLNDIKTSLHSNPDPEQLTALHRKSGISWDYFARAAMQGNPRRA